MIFEFSVMGPSSITTVKIEANSGHDSGETQFPDYDPLSLEASLNDWSGGGLYKAIFRHDSTTPLDLQAVLIQLCDRNGWVCWTSQGEEQLQADIAAAPDLFRGAIL